MLILYKLYIIFRPGLRKQNVVFPREEGKERQAGVLRIAVRERNTTVSAETKKDCRKAAACTVPFIDTWSVWQGTMLYGILRCQ